MKARILSNTDHLQKTPANEKNECPTKRREGEHVEPSGWWDEFDKPTKARNFACDRYCSKWEVQ